MSKLTSTSPVAATVQGTTLSEDKLTAVVGQDVSNLKLAPALVLMSTSLTSSKLATATKFLAIGRADADADKLLSHSDMLATFAIIPGADKVLTKPAISQARARVACIAAWVEATDADTRRQYGRTVGAKWSRLMLTLDSRVQSVKWVSSHAPYSGEAWEDYAVRLSDALDSERAAGVDAPATDAHAPATDADETSAPAPASTTGEAVDTFAAITDALEAHLKASGRATLTAGEWKILAATMNRVKPVTAPKPAAPATV